MFGIGHSTGALLVPTDEGPVIRLRPGAGRVVAIAFSAAGDQVATVSERGNVHLWNSATGALVGELPRPDADPAPILNGASAVFSGDGVWLAAVSDRLRWWKLGDRTHVCSVDPNAVFELRFPAGNANLLSTGAGAFKRWDLASCKAVDEQMAETGGTFGSALSPDGAWMAAAEEAGHSLSVFTTAPFRRKGIYARSASCEDHVNPWRFSRDGRLLLVTGNTRWFRSFRVGSFAVVGSWRSAAGEPPESVTPLDDGAHLVVRAASGESTVVDTRAPKKGWVLPSKGARAFDSSADSRWLVGTAERAGFLWEVATGRMARSFEP